MLLDSILIDGDGGGVRGSISAEPGSLAARCDRFAGKFGEAPIFQLRPLPWPLEVGYGELDGEPV